MPTRYLYHVTLTTGHVAETPRSGMRDGIAEMIRPVLAAGSGDLGGILVQVFRHEADMAALSIGVPNAVLMTVWRFRSPAFFESGIAEADLSKR